MAQENPAITDAAEAIIGAFRDGFLNDDGLISRTFPPSDRTIFDNLDDIAPFLMEFGEEDFLLKQIRRLDKGAFERLLPEHNVLYAAKIDEYLGGLNAIYRRTGDGHAKALLDDAVTKCLGYFSGQGGRFSESFDFTCGRSSPFFSPWSAGLLETFLEIGDLYPHLPEISESVLDRWIGHWYFRRFGLFPFRASFSPFLERAGRRAAARGRWCHHYPPFPDPPPRSAPRGMKARAKDYLRPAVQAMRRKRRRANYLYAQSGHWSQLMKSNTTPVFAMIELHRRTGKERWRDAVRRWIESAVATMVRPDGVHGTFYPPERLGPASLVDGFILIDVLCDAWWEVDRNPTYLDRAEEIARNCLSWRWDIGVIPMTQQGDRDHLDGQVDFSISLRRVGELADRPDLSKTSTELMECALTAHRVEGGFCTHVDREGRRVTLPFNTVDPKYNGLLLKGLIHLQTSTEPIYGSRRLMDLFKDR